MDEEQKQALKSVFGTPLTQEDHARRKREALRLKEQLSSIPWHAERGKKYGMEYWYQLLDSCAARGLPDDESSEPAPYITSSDLNVNDIAEDSTENQLNSEECFEIPEEPKQEELNKPQFNLEEALCILMVKPEEPTWFQKFKAKLFIFN